ncbi:hypothetical protein A4R89_08210 [Acetobacter ascendens]|nr:hypothetical protein A4R89_08210 [Acetobacter ascendens]
MLKPVFLFGIAFRNINLGANQRLDAVCVKFDRNNAKLGTQAAIFTQVIKAAGCNGSTTPAPETIKAFSQFGITQAIISKILQIGKELFITQVVIGKFRSIRNVFIRLFGKPTKHRFPNLFANNSSFIIRHI